MFSQIHPVTLAEKYIQTLEAFVKVTSVQRSPTWWQQQSFRKKKKYENTNHMTPH
jgi:hypothetical protein